MARPLRILYPGAFYHVTSRGNERKKIFLSKADYAKFKTYLREACEKFKIILHCYVLMENHYHLVVETPYPNLSSFMHYLNGSFTTYVNTKRKRCGHLFQGRYKAIIIDQDNYLLEVSRYIHLNPVRSGLSERPEGYKHSSYMSYTAPDGDSLIHRDRILSLVSNNDHLAPLQYRQFVEKALEEPIPNPFNKIYAGVILGKNGFVKNVLSRLQSQVAKDRGISRRKELIPFLPLDTISGAIVRWGQGRFSENLVRNMTIYLARKYANLTNAEIGKELNGLSYSAVAKAAARLAEKIEQDDQLRKDIERIEAWLSNVKP
jgi:REP element-mobilizing transposase RayT